MKGLFWVLILFAAPAVFAQNPAPKAQPPEPYHIKNDVLGEPISLYRQNNPECSDKDPITESANFYQAKTTAKWSGTCMARSFDPKLPPGKSTHITCSRLRSSCDCRLALVHRHPLLRVRASRLFSESMGYSRSPRARAPIFLWPTRQHLNMHAPAGVRHSV
jgi:hypothetical protein